jgi:acetyltransferase-like isoleucine patch superfamily enzyme
VSSKSLSQARVVKAVHGSRKTPSADCVTPLAAWLRANYGYQELIELYGRFISGPGRFDTLMREAIWRAAARQAGDGLKVGTGAAFMHLDRFTIGSHVFIGAQSMLQGRFDGTCVIGDHVWIGPQAYMDARDLVIEEYVGWGPGAKILGSTHTGVPLDVPIIQTDLRIAPVRIEAWADVGTGAVILPGVTVGRGSIIGAGAVVTRDVPPFSIAAGVPAKVIGRRSPGETREATRMPAGLSEAAS